MEPLAHLIIMADWRILGEREVNSILTYKLSWVIV